MEELGCSLVAVGGVAGLGRAGPGLGGESRPPHGHQGGWQGLEDWPRAGGGSRPPTAIRAGYCHVAFQLCHVAFGGDGQGPWVWPFRGIAFYVFVRLEAGIDPRTSQSLSCPLPSHWAPCWQRRINVILYSNTFIVRHSSGQIYLARRLLKRKAFLL